MMNEELPEPLNRMTTPAAPRALRQRVLTAVDRELSARRKPRWERVLELSVAATFVLGVGLNADLIGSGIQQIATGREKVFRDVSEVRQLAHEGEPVESFDTDYAKYLAQLSGKLPG